MKNEGTKINRILFSLFQRMGDVCCGIPSFHALKRKFPESELHWATIPKYACLVPKFGTPILNLDSYGFSGDPGKPPGYDISYYVQPMHRHDDWTSSRKHIIDLISKWCDVTLLPEDRHITIDIPESSREKVKSLGLPSVFVAICSSPAYSSDQYPFNTLLDPISQRCKDLGIGCVTVGGPDGLDISGTVPLHGKLSIIETVAAIERASIYVGPDNGTTWLACGASKTKKLCVLDKGRFNTGFIGFEPVLEDDNIHDMFFQEGLQSVLEKLTKLFEND